MEAREHWSELQGTSTTLFDFKWCCDSRQIKYDILGKHGQQTLVNHFENHKNLSQKDLLFQNMHKFCEFHPSVTVWDYVPLTFVVDITQKHAMDLSFDKFALYFGILEKSKQTSSSAGVNQLFEKVARNGKKPYELKDTMWGEENMWILKPNDRNCGRGVRMFNSLD